MACTAEAIVNSSEIAAREYGSAVENPPDPLGSTLVDRIGRRSFH